MNSRQEKINDWIAKATALKVRLETAGSNKGKRGELEKEVGALEESYPSIRDEAFNQNAKKEEIDTVFKEVLSLMYPDRTILGGKRKTKKSRRMRKSKRRHTRKH